MIRVQSGEEVSFSCLDASNGQITQESTVSTISSLVFAQLDQVSGPVYVEGALPGDTLQVDVISVDTAEWGWTGLIPGFGLLSDEFPEPALKIWTLDKKAGFAWFDEERGIKVPLNPFAGEMGVAPGKPGAFSTIPPYHTGGNLDTRQLTAGSTLYLPVEVEGALFSIGVCGGNSGFNPCQPLLTKDLRMDMQLKVTEVCVYLTLENLLRVTRPTTAEVCGECMPHF